jgi:hypothetical protein
MARKQGIEIPPEVERFFRAVEANNWEEIEATFKAINGGDSSASQTRERSSAVSKLWPAIIDAFGAAEQAHLVPSKDLLAYGHEILDSLEPGTIYIGGTDAGRWVPALVNESEGGRHVVITQNGLIDDSYLEYVRLQFGDELAIPAQQDSRAVYQEYADDARLRLAHDQQFPDRPKQVRPGEELKIVDGELRVSGSTAVMPMNEKLVQRFMKLNPEASFAMEESFPLRSLYADALPLGPIMELRAGGENGANFTAEIAADSLDQWQEKASQIWKEPPSMRSDSTLKNYSHDAAASGNLLAAHGFNTEAETTYRLSMQLWPGNPEATAALARLLMQGGRDAEAKQVLGKFLNEYPDQGKALELSGIKPEMVPAP